METNTLKILGLMTCYNRREKTLSAIRSLTQINADISFLILDDASSDHTKEALMAMPQASKITCLSGDGNSFYTGGMRLAMEAALSRLTNGEIYDYILLFNDDVDFDTKAVDRLMEKANHHPGSIWVGPTSDEMGQLSYGGVQKTSNFRPKYRIVMGEATKETPCDTFNANCVLIPAPIFQELGNMDPVYHHSLGDFDYGFCASKKGYPIYVADHFIGICPDNPTTGTYNDTSLPIRVRLRKKESIKGVPCKEWWHYLRKNYGFLTACIYSITPYIRILLGR